MTTDTHGLCSQRPLFWNTFDEDDNDDNNYLGFFLSSNAYTGHVHSKYYVLRLVLRLRFEGHKEDPTIPDQIVINVKKERIMKLSLTTMVLILSLIILMPPFFKVKITFGLKNFLEGEIPEAKILESATRTGSSQHKIEYLGLITEDGSKINGCWLTWGWLGENHHTEQDIIRMVEIFADNDIRILAPRSIAFVSDGTPVQGTWYYQTYEYYSNFVQTAKEANSDIIVLAWISDMAQDSSFTPPYERVKLEDAEVRANVIDVCKEIVSYGLDGIAVDFEAIEDTGMEAYVTFVNQLKGALPNKIICVTLGMWIDWIYEASFKMNVDYVIPMLYGADGATYESDQFITVSTKISESSNPKILLGISYIGLENAQKVNNGKIKGFFIFHYEKMQSLWPTWKKTIQK